MKMPWSDKSGFAKSAIICAVGLMLSTGLCGLNYSLANISKDDGGFLLFTGILELIAMAVFALGLLLTTMSLLIKLIENFFSKPKDPQ
jgi:hypothetical protein